MQTTASPKLPRRYVRLAAVRGGGGLTSTPPRPPPTNPTTNNSGPKKYLFEPRHGLPVVRETLDLGGLLRSIRSESVSRIYWFTQRGCRPPRRALPDRVQGRDREEVVRATP